MTHTVIACCMHAVCDEHNDLLYVSLNLSSPGAFTGHRYNAYWVVAVVSPVLFIMMFTKGILMALRTKIFKKYYITHLLTVAVSSIHTHMTPARYTHRSTILAMWEHTWVHMKYMTTKGVHPTVFAWLHTIKHTLQGSLH